MALCVSADRSGPVLCPSLTLFVPLCCLKFVCFTKLVPSTVYFVAVVLLILHFVHVFDVNFNVDVIVIVVWGGDRQLPV
jgi:hypothetical protein